MRAQYRRRSARDEEGFEKAGGERDTTSAFRRQIGAIARFQCSRNACHADAQRRHRAPALRCYRAQRRRGPRPYSAEDAETIIGHWPAKIRPAPMRRDRKEDDDAPADEARLLRFHDVSPAAIAGRGRSCRHHATNTSTLLSSGKVRHIIYRFASISADTGARRAPGVSSSLMYARPAQHTHRLLRAVPPLFFIEANRHQGEEAMSMMMAMRSRAPKGGRRDDVTTFERHGPSVAVYYLLAPSEDE